MSGAAPAARLHEIEKSFVPGAPVLRQVSLDIARGEIHALLGENGAGKSTLMRVLVGLVRPEAGALELAGAPVDWSRFGPAEAARRGVGMVHQHSSLVPSMTVAENWAFGDPSGGPCFHAARTAREIATLAQRFGLQVSASRRVEELSPGERQRAEILRALARGAHLLILDEPTAVLTPGEADRLFASLDRLRESGRAVIFISHKLAEVAEVADRVTVLRRGRVEATRPARGADAAELGRLMLGRELPPLAEAAPAAEAGPGEELLALDGLWARGDGGAPALRGLSLRVRSGEIVGLAGIDGNGQRELEEVLAGVRPAERGGLRIGGRAVPLRPRALRAAGLAQLSGDRESAGLIPGFSLAENWILKGSYDDARYFPRGGLDLPAARRAVAAVASRYDIRPPDPDVDVATLSGGNAQKLAVARELETEPRVFVAVNPTRGLDWGSARFVHEKLLELRRHGTGVLLVSTELDEVLALSDRVLALVRGTLRPIPAGSGPEEIGAVLLGQGA